MGTIMREIEEVVEQGMKGGERKGVLWYVRIKIKI
jgi:hypothetical protein